jgi:hypothetical protein
MEVSYALLYPVVYIMRLFMNDFFIFLVFTIIGLLCLILYTDYCENERKRIVII